MGKLEQYVQEKYDSEPFWFVEFVQEIPNQTRVQDTLEKKEYLSGSHNILKNESYKYNGKTFTPRKIVLQYAKTLLQFQQNYLLSNPITLTGSENVVKAYASINRKGKYDLFNMKVLDKVLKYGSCAEYIYIEDGVIKSKLIDSSEGYPLYDHESNLIAYVQAYLNDGISYYTVFTDDIVRKYDDKGGEMRITEQYANLSGLPIVYHNVNELDATEGRSILDDWIGILDNLEDLISKYTDSFYKFMNPIPVAIGQQLKGEGLPTQIVGGGLTLDDGSDFKLVSNGLDYHSFDTLYKTLLQSLLDISSTPAVSMNKTDISNLSEVSIKLMFSLASIQANMNKQFMSEGISERFDTIRKLLAEYKGITFTEDEFESLDIVFQLDTPANDKETIDNMKTLREMGGISLEGILEDSPYTTDVQFELNRIKSEGQNTVHSDTANNLNERVVV